MTEFEQRLTHEYSKLAEQYAQEQQQLSGQVARLAEQVRHLADQQSADQQGYVKWSKYMSEPQGILNAHVETLTKAYNELARLLDAG